MESFFSLIALIVLVQLGKTQMEQRSKEREQRLQALEKALAKVMDLSPRGIRTHLNLNRPIYARTAAYGHFGRAADKDGGFSWEKTDLVKALKAAVK